MMGGGMGLGQMIGATIQGISDVGQTAASGVMAQRQRSWTTKQIRKAREWQETLAKAGPSWMVEGLRNAGLNPILAVTSGGGFKGVHSGPNLPGGAAGSAKGSGSLGAQVNQAMLLRKQAELMDAQRLMSVARSRNEVSQALYHDQMRKLDEAREQGLLLDNRVKAMDVDIYTQSPWMRKVKHGREAVLGSGTGGLGVLIGGRRFRKAKPWSKSLKGRIGQRVKRAPTNRRSR